MKVKIDGKIVSLTSLVGRNLNFKPTGELVEIQRAVSADNIWVKFLLSSSI